MVKLPTYARFVLNVEPGMASASFPYDAGMIAMFKRMPGIRWHSARHCWMIPNDVVDWAAKLCKGRGWTPVTDMKVSLGFTDKELARLVSPKAYEYQRNAVVRGVMARRLMYAFEMGLGKTLTAIETLRLADCKRIVVAVPAMARTVWADEFARWWPENGPKIFTVRDGKSANNLGLELAELPRWAVVTSYELLGKLRLPDGMKLDAVVLDESHYIKEQKAKRSREVRELLARQDANCYRIFLSGTPITLEPKDLWHQLECLYPGRFGRYWDFVTTYCNVIENQYGTAIKGVFAPRAEELFKRLEHVIVRKTKAEVAHLLPPLITQTIRLPARRMKIRELTDALSRHDLHKADLDRLLMKATAEKFDPIIQLVKEDMETGASHICLLTYYQESANELAGRLQDAGTREQFGELGDYQVVHVDGTVPEKQRMALIQTAKDAQRSILVATMKSVNVGINLTKFSPSYFAEMYSAPGVMSQVAGRFHRIGGEAETAVLRFVALDGTSDEHIARSLESRLKEHGRVIAKGKMEEAIIDALEEDDTPAEFLSRIRKAAKTGHREDVYGG